MKPVLNSFSLVWNKGERHKIHLDKMKALVGPERTQSPLKVNYFPWAFRILIARLCGLTLWIPNQWVCLLASHKGFRWINLNLYWSGHYNVIKFNTLIFSNKSLFVIYVVKNPVLPTLLSATPSQLSLIVLFQGSSTRLNLKAVPSKWQNTWSPLTII